MIWIIYTYICKLTCHWWLSRPFKFVKIKCDAWIKIHCICICRHMDGCICNASMAISKQLWLEKWVQQMDPCMDYHSRSGKMHKWIGEMHMQGQLQFLLLWKERPWMHTVVQMWLSKMKFFPCSLCIDFMTLNAEKKLRSLWKLLQLCLVRNSYALS